MNLKRKMEFETSSKKLKNKKIEINLYCDEHDEEIPASLPPFYHCVECYEFMGETNSRQFCCKSYCPYQTFELEELMEVKVFHLRISPYYKDNSSTHYNEYHNVIKEFIEQNSNGDDLVSDPEDF